MRKHLLAGATALGIAAMSLMATSSPASAHGYTNDPVSRQQLCGLGVVKNCGQIQWEPPSVEGPKGFPAKGPADGRICSAGDERWHELDDMRNGAWPATDLQSGAQHTFVWKIEARHATTKFHYYITKDGWDSNKPLTRADLEPAPFLTVDYKGRLPGATESHTGTIPAGKTGRHMILAVWDVYDTGNAFYACSDVQLS